MRPQILALAIGFTACVSVAAAKEDTIRPRDLRIESNKPRAPEAGAGVIVASMRGVSAGRTGGTITFGRITAQGHAEGEVKQPVLDSGFGIASNGGRGKNDARVRNYSAYQAPPGRYAMTLFIPFYGATTHPGRQYCFATIGFDLAAGEVLYVGDYVGSGVADPAIDFDLADARRVLASAPALQQAVRPAQILEELEFECNWADMAQFRLTDAERALLVGAGAMPASVVVAAPVIAERPVVEPAPVAALADAPVPPPAPEPAPPPAAAPETPPTP